MEITSLLSIVLTALLTIASIASAVSAILAFGISSKAFKWHQEKDEPRIEVVVRQNNVDHNIIDIVIENTGGSLAFDIEFDLSRSIPKDATGLSLKSAKQGITEMDEGPLIDGIPCLAPTDTRSIVWGQYGGIYSYIGNDTVVVKATFKNRLNEPRSTISALEIKSFYKTSSITNTPLKDIAKHTEKMSRVMEGSASGRNPFTFETLSEREKRHNRIIEERRAAKESN